MKKFLASCVTFALMSTAIAAERPKAIFHTAEGDFTCELFPDKAPKTVENFIGLATGSKEWTNPETGKSEKNTPLYNNTKFHRTMPGFMIQGGDPLGTGAGGPGYDFANEDSDLTFNKTGVLAMANRGRDTNGSQFFVTVAPREHLNGGYTIFGQVISGQAVVDKIANKPSEPGSGRAYDPVTLKSVEIIMPGQSSEKVTTGTATDASTSGSK